MKPSIARSILVATDLTESSDAVLRAAAALARTQDATLHVVHVYEFPRAEPHPAGVADRSFQGSIARTEQRLEDQVRRTVPPGVRVGSREVVIFVAHRAILERATAVAADLIVLGPHRRHRAADTYLGSTAEQVIRSAEVPCLVVRGSLSLPLHRIVVPLDLSGVAQGALEVALTWAESAGSVDVQIGLAEAEVDIVHVLPRQAPAEEFPFDHASVGPELHRDVEEVLRRHPGALGCAVGEELVWGDSPAEEIVGFAARERADLLVLATHGRGAVKRALLGSVASEVTRTAGVPVLLVPPVLWRGRVPEPDDAEGVPAEGRPGSLLAQACGGAPCG